MQHGLGVRGTHQCEGSWRPCLGFGMLIGANKYYWQPRVLPVIRVSGSFVRGKLASPVPEECSPLSATFLYYLLELEELEFPWDLSPPECERRAVQWCVGNCPWLPHQYTEFPSTQQLPTADSYLWGGRAQHWEPLLLPCSMFLRTYCMHACMCWYVCP